MIPEFIVPRAAEETAKKAIVEFRDMFIAALEKVERAATEIEKEKEKKGRRCTVSSHRYSPSLSVDALIVIRGELFLMPSLFFLFCMVRMLGGRIFRSIMMVVVCSLLWGLVFGRMFMSLFTLLPQ